MKYPKKILADQERRDAYHAALLAPTLPRVKRALALWLNAPAGPGMKALGLAALVLLVLTASTL